MRPIPDSWAKRAERLGVTLGAWPNESASLPEVGVEPPSLSLSLPLLSLASISPSSKLSCVGLEGACLLGVGGTMVMALGLNFFGSPAALRIATVP